MSRWLSPSNSRDVARRIQPAPHGHAVPQSRQRGCRESIRGNPIDGVILLVGCDKTTPALLMGAASCDLPTIAVSGGPMLNGNFRGEAIGSGTHVWRVFEELKAGELHRGRGHHGRRAGPEPLRRQLHDHGHRLHHRQDMVEALGIGLTDNAAIPAVNSRRGVLAHMAGRRIVDLVRQDIRMGRRS